MNPTIKAKTSLNLEQIRDTAIGDKVGLFASSTMHKHFYQFMPYNTGEFADTVTYKPWYYIHNAPHSVPTYFVNKNYRTDKHEFAQAFYVQGGSSVAMPLVENDVGAYIKKEIENGNY